MQGPKIKSEAETRAGILKGARQLGCYNEVLEIFAKYDKLLAGCTNQAEREMIGLFGNQELHHLLSSTPGELQVGNKIIT